VYVHDPDGYKHFECNSTLSIQLYMSMHVNDPSKIVFIMMRDIATMVMVVTDVTQYNVI